MMETSQPKTLRKPLHQRVSKPLLNPRSSLQRKWRLERNSLRKERNRILRFRRSGTISLKSKDSTKLPKTSARKTGYLSQLYQMKLKVKNQSRLMLKKSLCLRRLLRNLKTKLTTHQLEELPSILKNLLLLEEKTCRKAKLHQREKHQLVMSQNQCKLKPGSIWSHSCFQELPNPLKGASLKPLSQPFKKVLKGLRDPKLHQLRELMEALKSQL